MFPWPLSLLMTRKVILASSLVLSLEMAQFQAKVPEKSWDGSHNKSVFLKISVRTIAQTDLKLILCVFSKSAIACNVFCILVSFIYIVYCAA